MPSTRNRRLRPSHMLRKGLGNTFSLKSDRAERKELEESRMASPRRTREERVARELPRHIQMASVDGRTQEHNPTRLTHMQKFDLHLGSLIPTIDRSRSQDARVAYGGNRRRAISGLAGAVAIVALFAMGPGEGTPDSDYGTRVAPSWSQSDAFRRATNEYLEATGRDPMAGAGESTPATTVVSATPELDSVWDIVESVRPGEDPRQEVDRIYQDQPNVQDGLSIGEDVSVQTPGQQG